MSVEPRALRCWAEYRVKMVGALDSGVEESAVFPLRHPPMRHAHFDEVAHHVELMVARFREMGLFAQVVEGVYVAGRFLRGKDNRNPLFHLLTKPTLSLRHHRVVAGGNLKRKRDRLHSVVDVGVAPRASLELHGRRLAGEDFAGGDKVEEFLPLSAGLHLPDTVRNPLADQATVLVAPEAVHLHVLHGDWLKRVAAARRSGEIYDADGVRREGHLAVLHLKRRLHRHYAVLRANVVVVVGRSA